MARARGWTITAIFAAVGIAGAFACNAGDDVHYDTVPDGGLPEGAAGDDARRVDLDGGVPPEQRPETSTLPPPKPVVCNGLSSQDGGCDTSAGKGCCLDTAGASCDDFSQYTAGAFCHGAGAVFLSCASSTSDSTCCWQKDGPGGSVNTRFRAACTGGIEACDPSQRDGTCTNGQPCTKTTCSKDPTIEIGFCGTPPAGIACP